MRKKLVETLDIEYSEKSYVTSTPKNAKLVEGGDGDSGGFEVLSRVHGRLESMKSGKFKAALSVIDAASKVSLYKVQEGKE